MTHPMTTRKKKQRGAALVEAAVVIPVMLVFIGLIMWSNKSYEAKLDKQAGTRTQVLYYASHNCEGNPDSMTLAGQNDDPTNGAGAAADKPSSKLDEKSSAGVSRNWNLAKAKPVDTEIGGSAVLDRRTVLMKRKISAGSEVACNEKRYDSPWTAIFQFIAGFAKSGGGFID